MRADVMTGLRGLRVLISGAGVAGPSLAWWLSRYGADTTVVEIAPELRSSGFAVDFRGPTHLGVLSKMGVLDELREQQTHGGAMEWVDEQGRELFTLPAAFAGGDIEVRRRDLSRVLQERSAEGTEYLFGDSVTTATEGPDGVRVEFRHHAPRTFDVLIGADGLHSTVRRIAFGPEDRYVRHLGYHLAGWDVPNSMDAGTTPQHYNVPGRMVSVAADQRSPDRAVVLAVFASPRVDYDWHDLVQQKSLITEALTGMSWHVPEVLAGLAPATDVYFDSISRVRVPAWSSGRTAILGDAAWGVTLGGMGVGTGIVGSYVLAGELAAAGGDHRTAFAAYENRMRPYAARWQRGANPGKFLAPATATGLRLRNAVLSTRLAQRMLVGSTTSMATDLALPAYELIG
jgi:2-polyprenyl-6-methoxyphenol hydroxylase-like FAD-dependent oxidoreductase